MSNEVNRSNSCQEFDYDSVIASFYTCQLFIRLDVLCYFDLCTSKHDIKVELHSDITQ